MAGYLVTVGRNEIRSDRCGHPFRAETFGACNKAHRSTSQRGAFRLRPGTLLQPVSIEIRQ